MCLKTAIATIICLCTASYSPTSFSAEEETRTKRDTFRISLGGAVNTFDTDIELNSSGTHNGIAIDFEDDLDFDHKIRFGWVAGYWRFANRHRIGFAYLPFKRTAEHTLDTDIRVDDQIIKVGAAVKSELKSSIYDFSYMYSIYQTPDLEIALTGGIYFWRSDFDLKAAGIIEPVSGENPGSFQGDYSISEGFDAPLPLFGFNLQYQMTPRWNLIVSARYLSVEIGDYDGGIATFSLGTDYFFNEKFGVGVTIGGFDLDVEADTADLSWEFRSRYKGLRAYLVYRH